MHVTLRENISIKAGEKPAVLFENDTQVVDQFIKMKAEGKNNQALALINLWERA